MTKHDLRQILRWHFISRNVTYTKEPFFFQNAFAIAFVNSSLFVLERPVEIHGIPNGSVLFYNSSMNIIWWITISRRRWIFMVFPRLLRDQLVSRTLRGFPCKNIFTSGQYLSVSRALPPLVNHTCHTRRVQHILSTGKKAQVSICTFYNLVLSETVRRRIERFN